MLRTISPAEMQCRTMPMFRVEDRRDILSRVAMRSSTQRPHPNTSGNPAISSHQGIQRRSMSRTSQRRTSSRASRNMDT